MYDGNCESYGLMMLLEAGNSYSTLGAANCRADAPTGALRREMVAGLRGGAMVAVCRYGQMHRHLRSRFVGETVRCSVVCSLS